MPTSNPRITVTLTPEVSAVLRQLSALGGNSQSSIVGELLQTSLPVFERVVAALQAASEIKEAARQEIAAGLERAQGRVEEQLGLILGEFDGATRPILDEAEKVRRRSKKAAEAASTPVPVTRGSGRSRRGAKGVNRERV